MAAAVLELLMSASLMLQPIDEDALKYVCTTARLLQVISQLCKVGAPRTSPSLLQRCGRV